MPEETRTPAPPLERLDWLLTQAGSKADHNPAEALEAAEEAQVLARKLKLKGKLADATFLAGEAARAKGDHRRALEEFLQAKALFTELDKPFELGRCLRRLGDLYFFVSDFGAAINYYLQARGLFTKLAAEGGHSKAALHLAHLHAALGNVLHAAKEIAEAKASYEQALADYQRLNYPLGIAGATYNLGLIAQEQNDFAKALAYYQQANRTATQLKDTYLLSLALSSEASLLVTRGNTTEARKLVTQSLALCQATQRLRGVLDNLLKLAEIELAAGNLPAAQGNLDEGLSLSRKLGDRLLEADALELLARLREREDKHAEALRHFRQAVAIREDVRSAENAARMSRLRIAHEVGEKERLITLLQEKQRLEIAVRWILLGGLVLALTLLVALAGRYRLRVSMERVVREKNAQLEAAYEQMEALSRTDELTGLPNRRACLELLQQEENRARRGNYSFSIILCDVDDFKRCNDEFGHECGDAVLRQLALLFRQQLRASDTVGRWGGEEFLFILPGADLPGALHLAYKLRDAVASERFVWEGQPLSLTATFGVSHCQQGSSRGAIREADMAMYRGKLQGKNTVIA